MHPLLIGFGAVAGFLEWESLTLLEVLLYTLRWYFRFDFSQGADARKDRFISYQPGLVMIGASMLWVGWFGFNAGSQLAADGQAAMSFGNAYSASVASLPWMLIEWKKEEQVWLESLLVQLLDSLITPASGSVGPIGAIIIGFLQVLFVTMCGVIKVPLKLMIHWTYLLCTALAASSVHSICSCLFSCRYIWR